MISVREQNLIADVLKFAHLAEMPKTATKNTIWLEGIAKIRLGDNSIAYGVVRRGLDLKPNVLYVNGNTAIIREIEEVYPYRVLDKDRVKKFGTKDKEPARISYLKSLELPYLSNVNLEEMTLEDLNKEVVKAAIYFELQDLNTKQG